MTNVIGKSCEERASQLAISQKELQKLLSEIERLKLENAVLRKAAGIQISSEPQKQQVQVSNDERQALLRKTV